MASHPAIQHFLLLSFASTHPSVLSFCLVPFHVPSLSASALLPSSLSLRSILSPPSRLYPFLSHPSPRSPRLIPVSKRLDRRGLCRTGRCSGSSASWSVPGVERHHRDAPASTNKRTDGAFLLQFQLCLVCYLQLLQIPELICARSLESITRTGLTSYVSKQRALRDKPRRSYLNQSRAKFSPTERC